MIYQVLSRPRTGSHFINLLAWSYSKNTQSLFQEYFSTEDTPEEYERKFKFLETGKDDNRHYCLKVQTGHIRDVSRIINYLKDYYVIITKRNPWDSYLSYMFQELNGWIATHKDKHGKWSIEIIGGETEWPDPRIEDIDEENFILPVNEESIIQYVRVYKRDLDLLATIKSSLPNTFTFNYDLEHNSQLKEIFPEYNPNYVRLRADTQKININYEAHIPFGLVDHYKTMFDKCLNE